MFPEYFDVLRAIAQPIRAAALPHTLDHVTSLLAALGNPQQNFRAVVVTGSTGKGTTCLRIAQGLAATGRKVGLYTSPHLHLFRERIAILTPPAPASQSQSGEPTTTPSSTNTISVGAHRRAPSSPPAIQPEPPESTHPDLLTFNFQPLTSLTPHHASRITQEQFVESARAVLAAQQNLPARYSTFETTTAIALHWFALQNIAVAVLEVGIGGRYDAVNAVANNLAVFTPIEAEHVAMLGGSLESVAWHKAGIIQPNGTAISVNQSPTVAAVLEAEARAQNATLHFVPAATDQDLHHPQPTTASFTPHAPSPDLLTSLITYPPALSPTFSLPARLERLTIDGHAIIIDGGHTPAAARHLREFIGDTPFRLIVGMLRDKDVAAYLSVFDTPGVEIICTTAPGDRALTADELFARSVHKAAKIVRVPAINQALMLHKSHAQMITVISGSFRMAAAAREYFGLLPPAELEESRLTRAIFEGDAYQSKLN